MSTFKRSNSNKTQKIVCLNNTKSNGRKNSLKSLLSRPSLVAPFVGIIYIVLVNICTYEYKNAVGFQSNNFHNRNLHETESEPEGFMDSTKNPSNIYKSPHEHAESIMQKAMNEGDSEKTYKRYNLNGDGVKNSLFTNNVDKNLNKKVHKLLQNGYKKKEEMQDLWKDINKNEKDKYDKLGKDIYNHYTKTKELFCTPDRFADATWKTVNEIFMLTKTNTETYLKIIFDDWFNSEKTSIEEYYLLLCATKLVWRIVMENIKHSCMGILTKCFELNKSTGKELGCKFILNKYKDAFSGTDKSRFSHFANLKNSGTVQNMILSKHNYEAFLETVPYIDEGRSPSYFLKSEYDEQPKIPHLEEAIKDKKYSKGKKKEQHKEEEEEDDDEEEEDNDEEEEEEEEDDDEEEEEEDNKEEEDGE
ncbi:hypothetical protein PFUGPA_01094 [Plasmodium falciparum Palo Alto/Uganda]|uniref:Plasmodium RESA N-terminal domain-containing protein n=1 Tax=Plasmodium falciparum (isolate Palo Alto / Uganda) TaxID=57270 RepID=W4J3M5_PLAFP|nr:hypothetical protein PFUGPA_01094 [Plasmodium falciparum Palo Alto/Uganda]